MNCPVCHSPNLDNITTRDEPNYTFRSYHCLACHHIVHTHEYLQSSRQVRPLLEACTRLEQTKRDIDKARHDLVQLQLDLRDLSRKLARS